jgi:hypothetical protein
MGHFRKPFWNLGISPQRVCSCDLQISGRQWREGGRARKDCKPHGYPDAESRPAFRDNQRLNTPV